MVGPAWDRDPPGADGVIGTNARLVMWALVAGAPTREPPSLAQVGRWHRALYAGVAVPSPSYRGELRDSDDDPPDLVGYEVGVGSRQGLWSIDIPAAVEAFVAALAEAVAEFDDALPAGAPLGSDEILAVVQLAAFAHGEWVRIHPFANGNGRAARVWANWVALRYGLPPFVRVKPRPAAGLYGRAAMASMGEPPDFVGDHAPTVAVFLDLLADALA